MNEQYYIKNKKQFRNAILEAKGGKRTSKEFAKLCGITEPTFSRLINMKLEKKPSLELLMVIADNAEDKSKSKDLLEKMKEACGYVFKQKYENVDEAECIIEGELEILKVYYGSTISSLIETVGNLQIKIINDIEKNPNIKYILIYTNSNEKKQLLEKYLRIPEAKLIVINVM